MTQDKNAPIEDLLREAEEKLETARDVTQREAIFAEEANLRFAKNLSAFEKYYPDLYQAIIDYEPRPDFCLHVTRSGHANFYMKDQVMPLYGDDPLAQAKAQVKRYTEQPYFGKTAYRGRLAEADERIHMQYMCKLYNKLHDISEKDKAVLKALPESYPTCLMFGLGLGYHLPVLLEDHQFDYLFICEPEIELFYASLFCIDWDKIIRDIDKRDGCLFLYIGVEVDDFFKGLKGTAQDIGAFSLINSYCYQHYPSERINTAIKGFFERYYELQEGFGFYNDATTGLAHAMDNIESNIPFFFQSDSSTQEIQDIPVFVVGNGPSLDEALPILKKYQDRVVILAAGTALQSLLKAGITPDFHVLVERPKNTYDVLVDVMPEEGYSNLNLLMVDVMYPEVPDLYGWTGMGLKGPEASSVMIQSQTQKKYGILMNSLPNAGPLVSNTAFSFASMFGFNTTYFAGVDNGYVAQGVSHSKLSIYRDDKLKGKYKAHENPRHEIEGNFGEKIKATNLLLTSKDMLEGLIAHYPNRQYYNIGSGAKINGAAPLRAEDVWLEDCPVLDKASVQSKIKSGFFKQVELSTDDQAVDIAEFESLCHYLIEIGEREFSTRAEAAAILKAQQRLIYAYRKSAHPHFFHVFKGTMLYMHCPLITLLYQYEDEEKNMEYFQQAFSIWHEFLVTIKSDFKTAWRERCEGF
ncbi:6-hydroxymethylpterin diphosphokinase MptE-like protein [Pseudoalteromonas ruthenica]|uniref:motility associated factor glycosyltransferase family protein n=1 Tax=Pseudoalteromonas ruthenica TaxID=151081 RepID=UPI00034D3CE4|nr:6-hydroxymethylpterin diphosphokinase MptE-like protein [Pseudoalteromonas ruthenica]